MTDLREPWEHPDWYDLHETSFAAGSEREPEHYRELLLALPPLTAADSLIDLGAGTGKVSRMVAETYPELGRVTLVEPNAAKLARGLEQLTSLLGSDRVEGIGLQLGEGALDAGTVKPQPNLAVVGSVLMPSMEMRGGTLREGLAWMGRALAEIHEMLAPGGWIYVLETLALPWAQGGLDDPCRRLSHLELSRELACAELSELECVYRFRDRVIIRGCKEFDHPRTDANE